MHGKVIIGTDLKTKEFDAKIQKLENKAEQVANNIEEEFNKKQLYSEQFDLAIKHVAEYEKQIGEATDEIDKLQKRLEGLANTPVKNKDVFNAGIQAKEQIQDQKARIKEIQELLSKESIKQEEIGQKIRKQTNIIRKKEQLQKEITNEIDIMKEKQEVANSSSKNIVQSMKEVGNSVNKTIKKVGRWALAVFGIRSAYMMIRNSMSVISQQDEKLASDLNYIKTALAYSLEPVVRVIVEWMKQLVFYIGYIIKMWTGHDIFKRANENLKKATGNAKNLKKELTTTSFDEMNILQDTSSGGNNGAGTPSFDFSDMKPPTWLEWIVKNKKTILAIISGLTAGITAWKLGLQGIKALGIGIAVAGLVYAIQSLIDFLKDPTFDNFINVLKGIAIAITGVAIAFEAWPVAVAGAIAFIVLEIIKNFDKIKSFFSSLVAWIDKNVLGFLEAQFGIFGQLIYAPIEGALNGIKTLFEKLYNGIKSIVDGIVLIFKGSLVDGIKKIFSGLKDILLAPFYSMKSTVETIFKNVLNFFIDIVNGLIDVVNKLPLINIGKIKKIGQVNKANYSGGGSRAKGGIFYPSLLPKLALGGIINNPGPGVPYHGAVIGERGAEAVVPLTDSQQMQLLGETIGRYVTINATIPVYAYSRQVDRQVRTIRAEDEFAFNR